jgi:hypothetical protein
MSAPDSSLILLPAEEAERLFDLEVVIDKGMRTFVEVGQALAEIRDSGLYRASNLTFEEYCAQRWGMSRRFAYNTIASSRVVCSIEHIATDTGERLLPPASEAVARELQPLSDMPEKLKVAWAEALAVGNDKPTAKVVKDVVAQYAPVVESKPAARSTQIRENLAETRIDVNLGHLMVAAEQIAIKLERFGVAALGSRTDAQVREITSRLHEVISEVDGWVDEREAVGKSPAPAVRLTPDAQLDAELDAARAQREEDRQRAQHEVQEGVTPAPRSTRNAIFDEDIA